MTSTLAAKPVVIGNPSMSGATTRWIAESVNNTAALNCMGRVHDVLFTPL